MTDSMVRAVVEHAALIAAISVGYWWATPRMLRSVLQNGGGDIVKKIVREANAEQSALHREALDAHELREFAKYSEVAENLSKVRERLSQLEGRVGDHLAVRSAKVEP